MRARAAITVLAVAVFCATLLGCARGENIVVTGSVNADVIVAQVPPLGSSSSTISAVMGLGSYLRVGSVDASVGANVAAGQILARFESASLDANVDLARANATIAAKQVPVLDSAIDETSSKEADLDSTRATLQDGIAQMTSTRAGLAAQLAQLEELLASMPSDVSSSPTVPPTPTREQLQDSAAQLKASIAQIDAGLAKAQAGLRDLASAQAKLTDARTQLRDLRAVAVIAAEASKIGVVVAQYQQSLSVVRSPVDGVLVSVATAGDLLAPGATVAVVRENAPAKVTTWLTAEQIARVSVGDSATVSGDWMTSVNGGRGSVGVHGTVSRIGERADYPPTSFATDAVHMTRAIPVEITISSSAGGGAAVLPPGAPVDVVISPSGSAMSGP